MSGRRAELAIAAAAAVALLTLGCAGSPGDRAHLMTAEESMDAAYGGWVEVRGVSDPVGRPRTMVAGELLAANADTLWILSTAGPDTVVRGPGLNVKLVCEHNKAGDIATYGLLMTPVCVVNGFFFLVTAPLTWLAAASDGYAQSKVGVVEIDQGTWDDCGACARFPQGMPPGLDASRLTLWECPDVASPRWSRTDLSP